MALQKIFSYVFFICVAEATAVSCMKKYASLPGPTQGAEFFALAVAMYALICYLLSLTFSTNVTMGSTVVLWSVMSIVFITTVGILFFGEKLRIKQIVAALLVLAGVYILNREDK